MLFIVSTALKVGKGGISSALVGFTESQPLQAHGFTLITSHDETDKKRAYQQAKRQLRAQVKPGDSVWLHCGPWLSMLRKWRLANIAKRRGAQVYFQFHSPLVERYLQSALGRWLINQMLKRADGLIVLTDWWQQLIKSRLPQLKCPVLVLGNPLDAQFEAATAQPRPSSEKDSTTILAMARLVPEKGVADVIRALAQLPPHFSLQIAGTGPQQAALEELADELQMSDRVSFLGWVSYEQKLAVMRQADLYCLPSRYDSFGMAFIEAMAVGLPVVALRQGGVPDVVKHGETGILVETPSATELSAAIQQAQQHSQTLGQQGQQYVSTHFAKEPLAKKLLAFITQTKTKKA